MEKKLKSLFQYQKFEQNERLAALIAESEKNVALTDDDLSQVNAAGNPQQYKIKAAKPK